MSSLDIFFIGSFILDIIVFLIYFPALCCIMSHYIAAKVEPVWTFLQDPALFCRIFCIISLPADSKERDGWRAQVRHGCRSLVFINKKQTVTWFEIILMSQNYNRLLQQWLNMYCFKKQNRDTTWRNEWNKNSNPNRLKIDWSVKDEILFLFVRIEIRLNLIILNVIMPCLLESFLRLRRIKRQRREMAWGREREGEKKGSYRITFLSKILCLLN